MIKVGVTGWGDHDDLYPAGTKPRDKLRVYSTQFPVVEVDSSFYAVQLQHNYEKWSGDTPEGFSFLIKAYQAMTGHLRGKNPFESTDAMYAAFKESVQPVIAAGKMKAVLFQYPPWFDCTAGRDRFRTDRATRHPSGFDGGAPAWTQRSGLEPKRNRQLA